MLIITRRVGEAFFIDDDIEVTVLGVKGNQIRIGINAPADMKVLREELYLRSGNREKGNEDCAPTTE